MPDQKLTLQRGERGIIMNDSDPMQWRVRFTQNGNNVEVTVPTAALFRVTKDH